MNRDDIIRMAREAEAYEEDGNFNFDEYEIKHFAALVAAAEREECAKVCEAIEDYYGSDASFAICCADGIRARGQA